VTALHDAGAATFTLSVGDLTVDVAVAVSLDETVVAGGPASVSPNVRVGGP
jgi:hypothetical protein